jgi:glutathione S-transferase
MKLYYSPGTCSLSPHIVARELGIDLTLVKVDLASKKTEDGRDFVAINPKGYVPALELDDGAILTEGTAIVQYLVDVHAHGHGHVTETLSTRLAPGAGTFARHRLQEALAYINTELHKSYGPLFRPNVSAEARAESVAYIKKRYAPIEKQLAQSAGGWLAGADFTIADAYLFVVTNWAGMVDVGLAEFPHLQAFQSRAAARPSVRAAMVAEGLLKADA